MFCKNCGKQIGPEIKFCPACGNRVTLETETPYEQRSAYGQVGAEAGNGFNPGQPQRTSGSQGQYPRRMLRPRSPRILGGVCAALAMQYGWNLNAVRILTALFGFFYGVGVLAYLACWIVIPEAQYALPRQSR